MKTKLSLAIFWIAAIGVAINVYAVEPSISNVNIRQRWPWSRLVDIDYVLDCDAGELMDVAVVLYDGDTSLTVHSQAFSGGMCAVSNGSQRIVFDPTQTAYTNHLLTQFRVELTPAPVPLYMIVDLTKAVGETNQLEYVYEVDLTNGLWGAWVRNPVTNRGSAVKSVIWTGVTTNNIYKTDKLVLRRILKGTSTKDFYAGVFQVTQRQWELIMGTKPSWCNNPAYYANRPVEDVSYNEIRGATGSVPSVDWPETGASVLPTSFMGMLRAKTGLIDFDLPTVVQSEYACRAGTTTIFNDGNAAANVTGDNQHTNEWMDALGRYKFNWGYLPPNGTAPARDCGPENGTAIVGSYLPNAWGLYDTHGNTWEWCLDWQATAYFGQRRMLRGGVWTLSASYSISAYSTFYTPTTGNSSTGLRLVMTLP
ncbi:MAG: formylglycine-generating enzyme family protein [Kiritimatiellia bacterium]